jgi:hypothetical protein
MLNAGGVTVLIVVTSDAVTDEGAPPPDTVTPAVSGEPALDATFTVTVKVQLAPGASASLRLQVVPEQLQPAPAIDTSVKPVGKVSAAVTMPLVAPPDVPLRTVIV